MITTPFDILPALLGGGFQSIQTTKVACIPGGLRPATRPFLAPRSLATRATRCVLRRRGVARLPPARVWCAFESPEALRRL